MELICMMAMLHLESLAVCLNRLRTLSMKSTSIYVLKLQAGFDHGDSRMSADADVDRTALLL